MKHSSKPRVVYKGKIFTITQQEVVDNKGIKHIVEKGYRPNIVTVIGIIDNKVLMIKEFRPGPEKYILWLPGGKVEDGENSKAAALKEFKEETGYVATGLTLFHKRLLSDNFYGEGKVYLAKGTRLVKKNAAKQGDEKGKMSVVKLPLSEAARNALEGKIPNEFFSFLILKLDYLIKNNKLKI